MGFCGAGGGGGAWDRDWERGGGTGEWARQRRWRVEPAPRVGEAPHGWGDAEIGIRYGWGREGELTFPVGPPKITQISPLRRIIF